MAVTDSHAGMFEGKKILFMDDEDFILTVVGKMAEKLKCKIVKVKNGDEAINEYGKAKDSGAPFDLVILDLTVPGGMGGMETISELKKIDPGVKALVTSGYSSDPVISNYEEHGFLGVIAKPFMYEDFAEILRTVIKV